MSLKTTDTGKKVYLCRTKDNNFTEAIVKEMEEFGAEISKATAKNHNFFVDLRVPMDFRRFGQFLSSIAINSGQRQLEIVTKTKAFSEVFSGGIVIGRSFVKGKKELLEINSIEDLEKYEEKCHTFYIPTEGERYRMHIVNGMVVSLLHKKPKCKTFLPNKDNGCEYKEIKADLIEGSVNYRQWVARSVPTWFIGAIDFVIAGHPKKRIVFEDVLFFPKISNKTAKLYAKDLLGRVGFFRSGKDEGKIEPVDQFFYKNLEALLGQYTTAQSATTNAINAPIPPAASFDFTEGFGAAVLAHSQGHIHNEEDEE